MIYSQLQLIYIFFKISVTYKQFKFNVPFHRGCFKPGVQAVLACPILFLSFSSSPLFKFCTNCTVFFIVVLSHSFQYSKNVLFSLKKLSYQQARLPGCMLGFEYLLCTFSWIELNWRCLLVSSLEQEALRQSRHCLWLLSKSFCVQTGENSFHKDARLF